MFKQCVVFGLCGVLASCASGVFASTAAADPFTGPQICPQTETAIAGTYSNLTISGDEYVAAGTTLNVTGNLTVAPGACFDAFTLGTVTVGGNVRVRKAAIFALGCDPNWDDGAIGPPCDETTTDDVVGGSVVASDALTMYIDGSTIRGSLISLGGGPGAVWTPYTDFPVKDNTIDGSVWISGWKGSWFGFIRNTVGGSVLLTDMSMADPDAMEVVTNGISGYLACDGDSPAPQFGDSSGAPDVVGKQALGQCAPLVS